jgi:hypothetical protein
MDQNIWNLKLYYFIVYFDKLIQLLYSNFTHIILFEKLNILFYVELSKREARPV